VPAPDVRWDGLWRQPSRLQGGVYGLSAGRSRNLWMPRPSGTPLVTQRCPSVAPSALSLGGSWGGCDRTDGTPTACFVNAPVWTDRVYPRVPGSVIVRSAPDYRTVDPAQWRARHARWGAIGPHVRGRPRPLLLARKLPAMIGAFDAPPQFVRRIARHTRWCAIGPRVRGRLRPLLLTRKLSAMPGAFDSPPQFVRRIARHTRGDAIVPRVRVEWRSLILPPARTRTLHHRS
jgi:hypothetical protein